MFPNHKWLVANVKQKLSDIFLNDWYCTVNESSKCKNYRLFKETFHFEPYLINTPKNLLRYVIKFRTRNSRLPVETGSWNGIDLNLRKCTLCNSSGSIGDEFHYLFECNELSVLRKRMLDHNYLRHPNILTFKSIMNMNITHCNEYRNFCLFVKEIITKFENR